jgi:hypothetical protein
MSAPAICCQHRLARRERRDASGGRAIRPHCIALFATPRTRILTL